MWCRVDENSRDGTDADRDVRRHADDQLSASHDHRSYGGARCGSAAVDAAEIVPSTG
jgi:hypothetical protein